MGVGRLKASFKLCDIQAPIKDSISFFTVTIGHLLWRPDPETMQKPEGDVVIDALQMLEQLSCSQDVAGLGVEPAAIADVVRIAIILTGWMRGELL